MEVQFHKYFASVLDVGERSASHTHTQTPGPFSRIQGHDSFGSKGLVSSSTGLDTLEQKNVGIKVCVPWPGEEPRIADGLFCNLVNTPG
jgi:hypothetical protein